MSILTQHRTAGSNPDPFSPGLHATRSTTTISRRGMMLRAGTIAGAAAAFPAPAISQGIREFKMATSWPKGLPGLSSSAERIGQAITAQTGKRIQMSVFAAGELVKPFEVFDAVSSGVVDMYHSAEYYWERSLAGIQFLRGGAVRFHRR
jgi:TRAP-type mannitol/chloroaromatic compound transport system substrate-binding protein